MPSEAARKAAQKITGECWGAMFNGGPDEFEAVVNRFTGIINEAMQPLRSLLFRCAVVSAEATGDESKDGNEAARTCETPLEDIADLVSDRMAALEIRNAGLEAEMEKLREALTACRPLPVIAAQKARCCRICGGPDSPNDHGPFVLDYGDEYAHQGCIDQYRAALEQKGGE